MTSSSFIPYGRQDIRQDDIDAVVSVLCSEFLTQGPKVPAFEAAVAAHWRCPCNCSKFSDICSPYCLHGFGRWIRGCRLDCSNNL